MGGRCGTAAQREMLAWNLGCRPPSLAKPLLRCGLAGVSRVGLRVDMPFAMIPVLL